MEFGSLMHMKVSIPKILGVLHETLVDSHIYEGHPEVTKWRGHEPFLCEYGFVLYDHMRAFPGAAGAVGPEWRADVAWHLESATSGSYSLAAPDWFGVSDFHLGEKSALLRIHTAHYHNHFQGVPLDVPEFWTRGKHG